MARELTKKLVGSKVLTTVLDDSGEYFGLLIQKGKRKHILWILSDPEANSGGFLDMQAYTDAAKEKA